MLSNRKQAELDVLLRVKALYTGFPQGEIEPAESPDFRVHTTNGVIGIEITYYTHEAVKNGSEAIQSETIRREISRRAQLKFEEKHPEISLWVIVEWSSVGPLPSKVVMPDYVSQIVDIVEKHYPQERPGGSSKKVILQWDELRTYELQNQYRKITIYRLPRGTKISWGSAEAVFAPKPREQELQNIIRPKESKLQAYRNTCDYVWLIINAGGYLSSVIDTEFGVDEELLVDTGFDEVLLFNSTENNVFTLKRKLS